MGAKQRGMLAIVAVALLGAAALLLLADTPDLLIVLLLAAAVVAGLAAWANERAGARRHAALDEKRRGEMNERTRRLERQVEEQRESLRGQRRLRLRTERARRAEREWSRELREQVLYEDVLSRARLALGEAPAPAH